MRALILAGGLGTRLRSVTLDLVPKPLVEVAGRPFIEYLLLQLGRASIDDVTLLVGHGAAAVRDRIGDGRRLGMRVTYSEEERPLGTGGALRAAIEATAEDRFLVLNGDSFVDVSLDAVIRTHAEERRTGALATLVLVSVEDAGRFGGVEIQGRTIVAFREKDPRGGRGLVSAGVYVLERTLALAIPSGVPVSLEREVWPRYLDGRLRAHPTDGAFSDIGEPRSLERLRDDPRSLLALAARAG